MPVVMAEGRDRGQKTDAIACCLNIERLPQCENKVSMLWEVSEATEWENTHPEELWIRNVD